MYHLKFNPVLSHPVHPAFVCPVSKVLNSIFFIVVVLAKFPRSLQRRDLSHLSPCIIQLFDPCVISQSQYSLINRYIALYCNNNDVE